MILRLATLLLLTSLCGSSSNAQGSLADRLDDLRSETSVRLALAENAELRALDVSIEAADGVVVLSGLVPTLGMRDRVVTFVSALPNVRVVRSTLRLEGQPDQPLTEPVVSPQIEVNAGEDGAQGEEPEQQTAEVEQAGPQYYIVQRGDTLYGIARHYETSVSMISELNNLSSTTVRVGQRLRVK